jgi:hypothetical protein
VISLAEMGPGGATEAETEAGALHPVAHSCPSVPCRKNAGAHGLQTGVNIDIVRSTPDYASSSLVMSWHSMCA